MAQLRPAEYDALERAIRDGQRVVIQRRGTEYAVIPRALRLQGGRELIEAAHPSTGDRLLLWVDEIDSVEVLR